MEDLILNWNVCWPLDRSWRKKYGVSFGSPAHRSMRMSSILFDIMEDRLISGYVSEERERKERLEVYRSTKEWLRPLDKREVEDDLFNRIKF